MGGFRIPDVDLSPVLQPANLSTFSAPNGTSLDAITPEVGPQWVEQSGNFDIQANRANCTVLAAAPTRSVATVSSGLSDCMVDSVVNLVALSAPGTTLRYSDNNNFWLTALNDVANRFRLWDIVGGVATLRAFAAVAVAAATDYDNRAIMDGQNITCFMDQANRITFASVFNQTATLHGIRATAVGDRFDNFAVYARTSTIYNGEFGAVP